MLNNLVAPLARRLGSWAAGAIGGVMVLEPAFADRVENWVAMGVLIAADLGASYIDRRRR